MKSRAPGARSLPRGDRWAFLAVLACTLVPIAGVLTTSRIFFVRDLGLFFFSRHLWLRHTLYSGVAPLWNPYIAGGQAALPDALHQILMPITVLIRLLPSEIVSFNLWVTLPLPLAGTGMFLFLRQRHGAAGSSLGAIAFALAGPTVSTLNAPNLSWSVAAVPWVLWSADRVVHADALGGEAVIRRVALLAVMVGLQALSGEPVTLASTAVVVAITAAWSWRDGRWAGSRAVLLVTAGLLGGALLASVQLVPTLRAGVLAHRASVGLPDFWSLHPFALLEAVAPHVFGNYYTAFLADMPWIAPLNSGREPFYYSLYVGPLVVLLAAAGAAARARRNAAWIALGVAFLIFAMGRYTPMYPLLRLLLPPLEYFRFPVKYISIPVVALAVLAAEGWESASDARARATVVRVATGLLFVGMAAALVILAAVAFVEPALDVARALAARIHVEDVNAGAHFLLRIAPSLLARSVGLLLAGGGLLIIAASDHRHARYAALLLAAALCADTTVNNADLNPTSPVERMSAPGWYRALTGSERVYIGGRLRGYMNAQDPDGSVSWEIPAADTEVEGRLELNAELPMEPSGWRVREAVSYDLPVLWPREYLTAMKRFDKASHAERQAFLRRSAVRWCVVRAEEGVDDKRLAFIPHWGMALYECHAAASRAFVAFDATATGDVSDQQSVLFDPSLPDSVLKLDRVPMLQGTPGRAATTTVMLSLDSPNAVSLTASLTRDGYVVLRDSYAPGWKATLDGIPVPIARANGLYRAVRVPAGQHVIRFTYRPKEVLVGLIVSGTTAVLILGVCAWRPRRDRAQAQRGFTLVELLIVVAIVGILLAIALARYAYMQRRANEGSAIASMRTIAAAEWQYAQTCGGQRYAPSLTSLGQPATATGQPFLSPDLTAAELVEKSGYVFQITAKPLMDVHVGCNGQPVSAGFAATADPARPGATGERYFGVNADRILYEDAEKTFIDELEESGPPKHGAEVK